MKGLKINSDRILKILLYADDVTMFLQDKEDVRIVLGIIEEFSKFSGLWLNKSKSEASSSMT